MKSTDVFAYRDLLKLFAISLCLLWLQGCTTTKPAAQNFNGENLITPYYADVDGWLVSEQRHASFSSRVWQHPQHGMADAYAVSLLFNHSLPTAQQRVAIDQPGVQACDQFESVTIQYPHSTPYATEYWETHCINANGTQAKLLHLLIDGNRGLYHLQKSWQGNFSQNAVQAWKERFERVYLCNTDHVYQPCPQQ